MLKAQESRPKLRPMYLFQANIEKDKPAYFFITDSREKIWVKQAPTDWQEIKIKELVPIRDGERDYTFHGEEFTKLFIPGMPSPGFFIELPYIEGKTSSGKCFRENLNKLLTSQEKLEDLGITKFLDLDLESTRKVTTQEEEAAHDARMKALKTKVKSQYFKKKSIDLFDEITSKNEKSIRTYGSRRTEPKYRLAASIFGEPSAGASSSESAVVNDEKLTEEVSKLTL